MGVGCKEGIFTNAHKVSPSVRPIQKFDSVNSVSVDLTDYRVHIYKYIRASQLELDEDEVYDFEDDSSFLFEKHGYYFLIGYTTGYTFDRILNYKSTNSEIFEGHIHKLRCLFRKKTFQRWRRIRLRQHEKHQKW